MQTGTFGSSTGKGPIPLMLGISFLINALGYAKYYLVKLKQTIL